MKEYKQRKNGNHSMKNLLTVLNSKLGTAKKKISKNYPN